MLTHQVSTRSFCIISTTPPMLTHQVSTRSFCIISTTPPMLTHQVTSRSFCIISTTPPMLTHQVTSRSFCIISTTPPMLTHQVSIPCSPSSLLLCPFFGILFTTPTPKSLTLGFGIPIENHQSLIPHHVQRSPFQKH
jgi:hypothetical protein